MAEFARAGVVFEDGRGVHDRAGADHRTGIHHRPGADEDAFPDRRRWRDDRGRVNDARGMVGVITEPSATKARVSNRRMYPGAPAEQFMQGGIRVIRWSEPGHATEWRSSLGTRPHRVAAAPPHC